jgi:hypothetical protein
LFNFFDQPNNNEHNPFFDPYIFETPKDLNSIEGIEDHLKKLNGDHYSILEFLKKHKETLRLFLELPQNYQDCSVIEMIEEDPYYKSCVQKKYKYVSALTPINKKDTIMLTLELVYQDFKDVVGLEE